METVTINYELYTQGSTHKSEVRYTVNHTGVLEVVLPRVKSLKKSRLCGPGIRPSFDGSGKEVAEIIVIPVCNIASHVHLGVDMVRIGRVLISETHDLRFC
jgi:hypothetical protein